MRKHELKEGQVMSYRTSDGVYRYRAIFSHYDKEKENCIWVKEFIVRKHKSPTRKTNHGVGGRALLYQPHYRNFKVLKGTEI